MNRKNLANGELASAITASATSITLASGDGANMPPTPFYGTMTPLGVLSRLNNSEIMKVTAVSGDTLTVVRGVRGTTARAFAQGSIFANGAYTEDIEIKATVSTAAGTAAKTASTLSGTLVPEAGMKFMFTFNNGNSAASPTMSVDGSTAYPIMLGNTAANTTVFNISGTVDVPMWFDGSSYHLYGSHRTTDSDTTYTALTTAEVDAGSGTTARSITGTVVQYIINKVRVLFAQTTAPADTNKLWYDTATNASYVGGDAVTLNGYTSAATPTANRIPVLDSNGNLPGVPWTSYSPTFTNLTIGNGTLNVKWAKVGTIVFVKGTFILGSTSSVSGDVSMTTPLTAVVPVGTGNIPPVGVVQAFNNGSIYVGTVAQSSATNVVLRQNNVSGSLITINTYSASSPFTWASGHQLSWQYQYETAL